LPSQARAPMLDTISALQYRLAEYIAEMLKSEETAEAIERFVDKQFDELLNAASATVSHEISRSSARFRSSNAATIHQRRKFRTKVRDFVSGV
jgi:cobalamin biosynthesis protein CbiD